MKQSNTLLFCLISFFAGALMTSMVFGFIWIANEATNDKANVKEQVVEETISEEPTEEPQIDAPQIGDKAPDFTLANFDGKAFSLSDYEGKKVILNFWVSWCPYCQKEAPELEQIHKEYKDKDVVVLTINLSQGEDSKEDALEYIEKFGLTSDVLLDLNSEAATLYNVQATPTNYFINTDGTINDMIAGYIGYDQLKEKIENMK